MDQSAAAAPWQVDTGTNVFPTCRKLKTEIQKYENIEKYTKLEHRQIQKYGSLRAEGNTQTFTFTNITH